VMSRGFYTIANSIRLADLVRHFSGLDSAGLRHVAMFC
jgi:hypothetical protein